MAKVPRRKKQSGGFDYSQLPPETANRLKELAAEIRKLTEQQKREFIESVELFTRKGANK